MSAKTPCSVSQCTKLMFLFVSQEVKNSCFFFSKVIRKNKLQQQQQQTTAQCTCKEYLYKLYILRSMWRACHRSQSVLRSLMSHVMGNLNQAMSYIVPQECDVFLLYCHFIPFKIINIAVHYNRNSNKDKKPWNKQYEHFSACSR